MTNVLFLCLLCAFAADEEFSLLHNMTTALSDDDGHYIVRLANSLFLQEGMVFNPEFLHLMRKYFRAEVDTVDFSESAAVADQINSWVENHTESKTERDGPGDEQVERENGGEREGINKTLIWGSGEESDILYGDAQIRWSRQCTRNPHACCILAW